MRGETHRPTEGSSVMTRHTTTIRTIGWGAGQCNNQPNDKNATRGGGLVTTTNRVRWARRRGGHDERERPRRWEMQQLQMLNIQYTTSRIGNFQFLTRLQPKLRPSSNSILSAESLPFVFDCLWLLTHWPRQQARFTLQWPLTA